MISMLLFLRSASAPSIALLSSAVATSSFVRTACSICSIDYRGSFVRPSVETKYMLAWNE